MANRLKLQSELEELLESENVYYQPPESLKINYDAIIYSLSNIQSRYANNSLYSKLDRYDVIVITRRPDPEVIDKLLALEYCSFDRHYVSDNLNHYAFTLYY